MPSTTPCPGPEGGRWKGYLSEGERQRLVALAAGTANALLVMFVLAVALPLLHPKLADPFWLLASTGAFCTNGFLALLAVLLLPMAAALEPQSVWHQSRRLLLLPLQGLAAWRGLEVA